jgi:hypothetical protein
MAVTIGAPILEDSLSSAALGLGLPLTTSKGGIIRAGLAIFAGKSRDEARRYAASKEANLGSEGITFTTALVPEELLSDAEQRLSDEDSRAFAVRVGLAMAAGATRKQAESFARLHAGRPRKQASAA